MSMITADLMTDEVPPLKATDSLDLALKWMEEFKVAHLPVIDGKQLMGLISETDILDSNKRGEGIIKSEIGLLKPVIDKSQHAFEALKIMTSMNLSLLPVLDEQENYAGSITQKTVLSKMSGLSAVNEPGGIIELEINKNDYVLTQIASIVEGNDAKILSLMVASTPDPKIIEITLKINREDLSRILQTFHRYNYNVKASYHLQQFEHDVKNKFDEFMRYLDI